ncbi:MAG: cell division protein [Candidatus Riflebacteria bacterium GWC2_50_8]|nr:MAG: cell division protein [Candidatus Riflebacteria bacterium GWC2_50_8]
MPPTLQLQIGKWGNSLGIRLPKSILEIFHLSEKDKIKCSIEDGKLVLEPVTPQKKYVLDDLLAQVREPEQEVSWGKPEGEEVW